jgi:ABC-type antimicrobial peptide transport system permease subunit
VGAKRFADLSHNKGFYGAESKDPGNASWRMLLRAFRPQTTTEVKKITNSEDDVVALGLVLSAVGLCGVMADMVEQRTGEIGVRMALGADRGRVLRMVLRGAFSQVAIGLAIGIPAATGAGKLMTLQLFGDKTR